MKRLLIVILSLAILSAVGAGIFHYVTASGPSIEDVLPEGAVFYVKFLNLRITREKIVSTKLWQNLRQVDASLLFEGRLKIFHPSTAAVLDKLFGREAALAVYEPDMDISSIAAASPEDQPRLWGELVSNVFLVTRLEPDVQWMESVSGLLGLSAEGLNVEDVRYEGETIRLVTIPDSTLKIGFVRLKDLLIIGVTDKAARRSVDVYHRSEAALAADPNLRMAGERSMDPVDVIGYVHLEELLSAAKKNIHQVFDRLKGQEALPQETDSSQPKTSEVQKKWDGIFGQASGLTVLGFSGQWADAVKIKFDLFLDKAKLDSEKAALYTCAPGQNKTLGFIPKDILGYQWNNCSDFEYYWKQIKKESAQDQMEQTIGLSLETDILPVLGDEIGGYLSDIRVGAMFPYPQLLFFVEVNDQDKAGEILTKLTEHALIVQQAEEYKSIVLHYISLPFEIDIQPAYCLLDSYLLAATNRQLLKDSIDAFSDPSLGLSHDETFQAVDLGTAGEIRSFQFARVGQIMGKMEGVLEWSKTWIDSQDARKEAFKSGSQKRLADVDNDLNSHKMTLEQKKARVKTLEEEIWDMESRGLDVTLQRGELKSLGDSLKELDEQIASAEEQKKELVKIISGYDNRLDGTQRREHLIEGMIRPLLKSAAFIRSYGTRTTLDHDVLTSLFFLKVE